MYRCFKSCHVSVTLFKGYTPVIPLDESKGMAELSDHVEVNSVKLQIRLLKQNLTLDLFFLQAKIIGEAMEISTRVNRKKNMEKLG